mgnify:CR=1 FL=1
MSDIAPSQNVICPCKGITEDHLRATIKAKPHLSFEDLVSSTGAGTKCTACMLDLEYYFLSGEVPPDAERQLRKPRARRPFKRRVYDAVDMISPKLPIISRSIAPVMRGVGIEQHLWISNYPMLFEEKNLDLIVKHKYSAQVRDASGEIVQENSGELGPTDSVRLNVSDGLKLDSARTTPFAFGSLHIDLWANSSGFRGSTRPQIEIVTANAACAVHTQGATRGQGSTGFECLARPHDEQLFVVAMNASDKENSFIVEVDLIGGSERLDERKTVSPFGAALFRVPAEHFAMADGTDRFLDVTIRATDDHKSYLLCSTPNYDRFSVDHL